MTKELKKPKIIFIDLDGTTIDKSSKFKKDISEINQKGLAKLKEKYGLEIFVSTGRAVVEKTKMLARKCGNENNFVAWNGAKVLKDGQEIFSAAIDQEVVEQIFELAEKWKMTIIINSNFKNGLYSNSFLFKVASIFKKGKCYKLKEFNKETEVFKLLFLNLSKKKLHLFAEELKKLWPKDLNVSISGFKNEFLEVTSFFASKGSSNKYLAKSFGVDAEDCWHVGDSQNDSTASGHMGYVIAMKNSVPEFKDKADFISPFTNKKGGLYKTLEMLLTKFE
ncbi:HAD-IIB family hydrolase [Mycoplasmopsis fermentans]|nr:HAD-IIB family hydrolase [Mycoplasmopsis fermentans]ADN69413.1 putative COF family HAD hydrolase protein [Mycoplasmopsis fermentans JER]ADV35041.1 COF family HAD hydrolase protein [Mycoplasmopsis fermentans M64]VEU60028.1 COF family HAD hydrolase protein [Mycoplasmopsis fermentans]VEU66963.1 COF family HAD hydrolase protein [Mesomycoplasma conjunctivae]